jgi:menaquinone-dependent protoporphyrinogen oxidase
MVNRILIAYGTRAGSTQEIAERIGDILREAGAEVHVRDISEINDISDYQSVIVGSAIRIGNLIPETVNFAQKFRHDLVSKTTAYFVVCMTMCEDTPENRHIVKQYLEPLGAIKEPVSVGLFAGKIDRSRIEPFWRFMLSQVMEGQMPEGDFRDWYAIGAWAHELAGLLVKQGVTA